MFKYFVFFMFVACSVANAGEIMVNPKNPTYHNARFSFSLAWTPGNYTVFEADNGDGITVTDGKGLTMQAYAALDPRVGNVRREDFFAQVNKKPNVVFKRVNKVQGWYAISYVENGNIIYTKQFYHKDHWPTLHFEYPQSMKKHYDELVNKAVSTFKPF